MTEVVDGRWPLNEVAFGGFAVQRLFSFSPARCARDPAIASANRSSAVQWCCGSTYCLECWGTGISLFNRGLKI